MQHDNAHVGPPVAKDDVSIAVAGHADARKVKVVCQPPQLPNLDVLDLGLLNSLQVVQYQRDLRSIKALVDAVKDTFDSVPAETINRTFIGL